MDAPKRTDQYLTLLSTYRSALAEAGESLDEEALFRRHALPLDLTIPENDHAIEDHDEILRQVRDWTQGTMREEDIQILLFRLDENYQVDYAFMLLGIPLVRTNEEQVRQEMLEFGQRLLHDFKVNEDGMAKTSRLYQSQ